MAGKIKDRTGEVHILNDGSPVEIIEYINCYKCKIKFENGEIIDAMAHNVVKGNVANPFRRRVFGVGYFGVGRHNSVGETTGKTNKMYNTWYGMFERCYCPKYHLKQPTYIGCSVDEKWHCFQDFGDWFEQNYNPEYMQDWHLDKDILVKGNRIYSPDNCRLIPRMLNAVVNYKQTNKRGMPTGVYKEGKKYSAIMDLEGHAKRIGLYSSVSEASEAFNNFKLEWIKTTTEKWKELICPDIYNTLKNYKNNI